jgi:hypothetical protein
LTSEENDVSEKQYWNHQGDESEEWYKSCISDDESTSCLPFVAGHNELDQNTISQNATYANSESDYN